MHPRKPFLYFKSTLYVSHRLTTKWVALKSYQKLKLKENTCQN